ncbi:MAG TPA: pseudouridine-5'-phosphate glycosidase [Pyrinomonadaceae bacterium]|nr:pseudouridine-5'-phosphate glycosidase [Pyrinomonadaceae bacterium]
MSDSNTLHISGTVSTSLSNNKPVVALESTVIAHGLPRPTNLETARRLEAVVSEAGATPATIAIIDGQPHIGLDDKQLELLATSGDIKKVSIRDLSIALAQKWNGATTVASTCWIAHRAGIKVFATGGIGGVHRGSLPDVSADLPQLAQTPIVVVCSGAKIVLDLPATREWLETFGVTVVGYQCDEMPAFYSRGSGLSVDVRVESATDVAEIFKAHQRLEMRSALLVTVPVPAEFDLPLEDGERVLAEALQEARQLSITGRDVTPFLLAQMSERSGGATLKANIALLENNARVAAEIAKACDD